MIFCKYFEKFFDNGSISFFSLSKKKQFTFICRKPDFINTLTIFPHPSWTIENKSPSIVLSATAPEYKRENSVRIDEPVAEDEKDVFLGNCVDEEELCETERFLTEQIGFPIRLIFSKIISSKFKQSKK